MNTKKPSRNLRFVIIGAGMAGILSGIKLQQAGYSNVTIYEKAKKIGGTWRENTYPGLTCDVPSHAYTYSFEPNPEWSHQLPPGAEVQQYFEGITAKYQLEKNIQFNQEISRCEFIDGRWQLETKSGTKDQADIVIAATGVLHHPRMPDIAGIDDFDGAIFHTARWDHSVPLADKRIGVIGNGSTGVQIISALSSQAAKLIHFQRTAQWIMPVENPAFTEQEKEAFRNDQALLKLMQKHPDYVASVNRFTDGVSNPDSAAMQEIEDIVLANLENSITDPILKEKLRPNYRAACKRLIFSPDYYQAIQKENVHLEDQAISHIEKDGVRLKDGTLHELDVIALASGFHADQFMRPMNIIGNNGIKLNDVWASSPRAYLSISIPEFPNLFMLNGPNGPSAISH
ncbi:NAD(P)/FAD-dependent oxidoreductase [Oceanicoccus sp. KOV_DT_Chl]|uniref:flavin-containing monooxygenase n=1 Tax=Oceanicoccus sp. KOV_DT_Chl TaxID=1904639 RepID=UPI001F1B8713|nr:NAD(P)/FAD-dependent oxidoreductase [Oceanicoccus sp. KOV_DT_Chl]